MTETAAKKSAEMVMVCLNWAHDLKYRLSKGRTVTLNGAAHPLIGKTKGALPVGEFGMTMLSAAEWEELQKTYGKTDRFVNGLVFVSSDKASAMDEAEDKTELRHGLEPVDPKTAKTKKADD